MAQIDTSPDRSIRDHRRAHVALTVGLAALTALGTASAWEAWRLGVWTAGQPGPGLWPMLVSVALLVAVIEAFRQERHRQPEKLPDTSWRRELAVFASLLVYIIAFAYLGPSIPTAALLLGWLKGLAAESWPLSVTLALTGAAAIYVVFSILLRVPFPSGPFT